MSATNRIGRIENQRERAVASHISRKTSEIWGTRPSPGNQSQKSPTRGRFLGPRTGNSTLSRWQNVQSETIALLRGMMGAARQAEVGDHGDATLVSPIGETL